MDDGSRVRGETKITASKKRIVESRKKSFVFREGDQTIANVAGRKDVEFLAQTAAGAAIVGDGDHGSQIADGISFRLEIQASRRSDKLLQATEESGETGAASDGYNSEFSLFVVHDIPRHAAGLTFLGTRILCMRHGGGEGAGGGIQFIDVRIKKFSEAGIIGHLGKIGVVAGLEAIGNV